MSETSIKSTSIYTPSLSSLEVELLSTWERERRSLLTTEQIRQVLGPGAARRVASSLVRKHVLARVGRGTYWVRPFRSILRETAPSPVTVAAALLSDERYYLGGRWALTFHRLSRQQYISVIDAFVTRRHAPINLPASKLAFHVIPSAGMSYGLDQIAFDGIQVVMSDVERTLLDLLDYRSILGIERALSQFVLGLGRANSAQLIRYAAKGSRVSTCQRLGVLLERARLPDRQLAPLRRKVRASNSLLSMLPAKGRCGHVNTRWKIVENDV